MSVSIYKDPSEMSNLCQNQKISANQKASYFSLAWASDGAPVPFPLAYIALEAGLFVDAVGAEDSNVMDVLVGTEN